MPRRALTGRRQCPAGQRQGVAVGSTWTARIAGRDLVQRAAHQAAAQGLVGPRNAETDESGLTGFGTARGRQPCKAIAE